MKSESAPDAVQIHDYRSCGEIARSVILLVVSIAFGCFIVAAVASSRSSSDGKIFHPTSPWTVALFALIIAGFLLRQGLGILTLLNSRIVTDGDEVIFRTEFKREVRIRKDDVLRWEPKMLGPRRYNVATTAGQFRYSPEISRRAELDRFFRSAIGFHDPEPEPAPRQWSGKTRFRLWSSAAIAYPAIQLFYVGLLEWITWKKQHTLILWQNERLLNLALLCMLVTSGFYIIKIFRESLTIEGGSMIFKDVWGRKRVVLLDDITSIDYQPFNIAAPRLYTRSGSIPISTGLKDYKELVWRIQRMTASPNP